MHVFLRYSKNITCDINSVILSGNIIDYVNITKYLSAILFSVMKIAMMYLTNHVSIMPKLIHYCIASLLFRQSKMYTLYRSFYTNLYCSSLWFNSTLFITKNRILAII